MRKHFRARFVIVGLAVGSLVAGYAYTAGASEQTRATLSGTPANQEPTKLPETVLARTPNGSEVTINYQRDVLDVASAQDRANPAPSGSYYRYRVNDAGVVERYSLCHQEPKLPEQVQLELSQGAVKQVAEAPNQVCDKLDSFNR